MGFNSRRLRKAVAANQARSRPDGFACDQGVSSKFSRAYAFSSLYIAAKRVCTSCRGTILGTVTDARDSHCERRNHHYQCGDGHRPQRATNEVGRCITSNLACMVLAGTLARRRGMVRFRLPGPCSGSGRAGGRLRPAIPGLIFIISISHHFLSYSSGLFANI
jgi:hypothetical protein